MAVTAALLTVAAAGGIWLQRVLTPPVNVLLITLDTTRADALSCYRQGPLVTSPILDRLADQSILFEYCLSPVPMTLPGHASILTGLYPRSHGARYNGYFVLSEETECWAEVMRRAGYRTAAFISAFVLDSIYNLDQGFELYSDEYTISRSDALAMVKQPASERRAEETTRDAERWLTAHGKEPFFVWLHYFDPHFKYDPPAPYNKMFGMMGTPLYFGEIAYVDNSIGRLLDKLKQLGVYQRTLIVVSADHGEGLNQHGELTHSFYIYDTTLHVPLIIHLPGQSRGVRIGGLVRLMDIMPTVLDYLDLPSPGDLDGRSLMPLIKGKETDLKLDCYAGSLSGFYEFGWPGLYSYNDGRYKYIIHKAPEMYDLYYDPGETRNILADNQEKSRRLRGKLLAHLKRPAAPQRSAKPDEQSLRKLRSLGYLMSSGARELDQVDEADFTLDYLAVKNVIQAVIQARGRIMIAEREKEVREEVKNLEAIVAEYGESTMAMDALAEGYRRLGRKQEAVEAMLRLIEVSGREPAKLKEVAIYFGAQGRMRQAIELLKEALLKYEERGNVDADIFYLLANGYLAEKDFEQAREYYRQGRRLDPENHLGMKGRMFFEKLGQ